MLFLSDIGYFLYISFWCFSSAPKAVSPPCAAQQMFVSNAITFQPDVPQKLCVSLDLEIDPKGLPTQYTWYFSDGTIKKGVSVEHCFKTYGIYDVQLKTETATPIKEYFLTTETTKTIYLTDMVGIDAQITKKTGYFDGSNSFIDNDFEVKEYYWNFGDGTYSCGKILCHSFEKSGNYTVKLIVEGVNKQGEKKLIGGEKTFLIK